MAKRAVQQSPELADDPSTSSLVWFGLLERARATADRPLATRARMELARRGVHVWFAEPGGVPGLSLALGDVERIAAVVVERLLPHLRRR